MKCKNCCAFDYENDSCKLKEKPNAKWKEKGCRRARANIERRVKELPREPFDDTEEGLEWWQR